MEADLIITSCLMAYLADKASGLQILQFVQATPETQDALETAQEISKQVNSLVRNLQRILRYEPERLEELDPNAPSSVWAEEIERIAQNI